MASLKEQAITQGVFKSFSVVGADARTYLHSQLTCDLLGEFDYSKGLLLEPDGKLIDILHLFPIEGGIEVVASSQSIEEVANRLRRFLLRTKATVGEIADVSLYLDDDLELAISPQSGEDLPLDEGELLALRLITGDVARGHDYQEALFPNALIDIDRYVSFTKGCYVGQEYVERTHSRGATAPKNLGLFASTSAVKGPILQGESEVGATLVGMDLLAVDVRDELKSALKEKFGSHDYLFFGIYSRKLQAAHSSDVAIQDEVKPLTAANESGELIEVYRLS